MLGLGEYPLDRLEDGLRTLGCVDAGVDAASAVVVDEGCGLGVVRLKALLQCLCVVV